MANDFPIGISLGPDHHTSAYITRTNEVVTAASIEASQAWKKFFLDTLRVKRNRDAQLEHANTKEVEELISCTLSEIRQATEKHLGRSVEINSIAYPEHFKGIPYVTALAHTAIKLYPEIKDVTQLGPYLNYVRLAYGLNTAEALGYASGAELDDHNSLLLQFEYQKEFLEVSIMAVTEYVDLRERIFRIDCFGGSENIATPEELADLKSRTRTLVNEQIRDTLYAQTQLEDFRFIIFSGEAAPSEFQKIRAAIIEIVPEFADRFRDSIDPFWVGATGAACCAREYAIKPPVRHIDFKMEGGVNASPIRSTPT